MAEIVIVRHGETAWNAEGRFQGHADIPLSDAGRAQAEALAEQLASQRRFSVVYSSDLARALETAAIVARRLDLDVLPERGLREIDVGLWSGSTRAEIDERWPGALQRWSEGESAHGGESRAAFGDRVERTVLAIGARHPGGRVLLVAHGGVIRALQRIAQGSADPVVENCGLWSFHLADGRILPAGAEKDPATSPVAGVGPAEPRPARVVEP